MLRSLRLALATLACISAAALPFSPQASAHEGVHDEIERASRTLVEQPSDFAARLRRAELRRLGGDWAGAEKDLAAVRVADPNRLEVSLCAGALAIDRGFPAIAIEHLGRFLVRHPDDSRALRLRAGAWRALGRPAAAAIDLERALAHTRRVTPELFLELSLARRAAGASLDDVLGVIDDGIARLGSAVTLELAAAQLEVAAGRFDAALARVERVAHQYSRREVILQRRAEILTAAGRHDEARAVYAAALAEIESLPEPARSSLAVLGVEESIRRVLDKPAAPEEGGR
ncbi:MAG TPA: tetratricopeptide repeat protein [Candidatus Limnocylindria bacterium]|nr:tetratricopeptide repeat protein [Candidatus Limnocylindria bacterium]